MNREQFVRVVSQLDEDRLRKALWNLYWRAAANLRERIEAELTSDGRTHSPRPAKEPVDPETVQFEVNDFVSLARSGAYMGGDRRASPRERSRWRFTFNRLAAEAQDALRPEDAEPAASALEQLTVRARWWNGTACCWSTSRRTAGQDCWARRPGRSGTHLFVRAARAPTRQHRPGP